MGAVNVALNERRVLVPNETFASNVSPPPKTFRILLVALWGAKQTGNETDVSVRGIKWMRTHRVTLAVSDLGGGLEKEAGAFSRGKNDIDVAGLCCGVGGGF